MVALKLVLIVAAPVTGSIEPVASPIWASVMYACGPLTGPRSKVGIESTPSVNPPVTGSMVAVNVEPAGMVRAGGVSTVMEPDRVNVRATPVALTEPPRRSAGESRSAAAATTSASRERVARRREDVGDSVVVIRRG